MKQESYIIASKIAKSILNVATDNEKSDVAKWSALNKENKNCIDNLVEKISKGEHDKEIDEYDAEQAWNNIEYKLVDYNANSKLRYFSSLQKRSKNILELSFYKYTAVVILALILSVVLYKYTMPVEKLDIKSINEGAYMVLANGEVLNLGEQKTCKSKDYIINNNDSINTIYYNLNKRKAVKNNYGFNIIKTEKGSHYSIYLPDGTLAHLSSASMLKFPETFDSKNRVVEVVGEVFFDVAHNDVCPFIVKTFDVQIQVLGTLFNVCAYDDSKYISATLVEGSIKMAKGDCELMLKPNQKAVALRNVDKIDVENVDAESEVSWIKGNFSFRNEPLSDILKSLSRWYDFKYVFLDSECEDILVGLNLEREVGFQKIVEILRRAELFGIKVSGNKLIISKKI